VIAVDMGIDEKANRLARDLLDRRDQLLGQRLELRIDEQHAVGAREHADRATQPLQGVEVISQAGGLDLHLAEVRHGSPLNASRQWLSLNINGCGEQDHGEKRAGR
jgi:hypothetical protein